MSLLSAAERFAAIDRSEVVLNTKQCLYSHDHFSACEACFELCPVGAIQPGQPPVLDAGKCQTCLACLPACPVGAYTADDGVQSLLTCVARMESKTLELVCALHNVADEGLNSESTGIRVRGCLAGLGVGTYMALIAMGIERIILRLDACLGCPWHLLQDRVRDHADQANRLLARWEMEQTLICVSELNDRVERPLWDAKNPPLSRRDLFRMAAQQGQVAVARTMEQERTGNNLHPGRDRLRLIRAVAHLPEPGLLLDEPVETGNFATLSVSEKCNACATCTRVCPTGSLKFHLNDEKTYYQLSFDSLTCVGCEACVHVCAPKAIELEKAPTFIRIFGKSESFSVAEGELSQCLQCKTLFAANSGKELCPVCRYRKKNPFGSMMPPGIKMIGKRFGDQKSHDS